MTLRPFDAVLPDAWRATGMRPDAAARARAAGWIAFVTLAALAWLLPGLLGRGPWKSDEGYSFGLVLEMLEGGQWIIPTLAGEPFMEKPPLMYWLGAGFAGMLQGLLPLHLGARAADVFCALVAFVFTWLAARESGERHRPWVAVLLLAGSPAWLYASKFLIADVGLVAWQAVALYGTARLLRRADPAGAAWLAVGLGTGFLTKGLVSVAANGVALLILLVVAPRFRQAITARNLVVFALAAAPWFVAWPAAVAATSPELFMTWFWDNNVGRFLGLNRLGPPNSAFARLAAVSMLLPVLPVALAALWGERGRLRGSPALAAVAMAFGWALVLGASAQSRGIYWIPALVPLSVLGAALHRPAALARLPAHRIAVAGAGLALAALLALKLAADAVSREDLRIALAGPTEYPMLACALLLLGAYVALRRHRAGWSGSIALGWTMALTIAWSAVAGLFERGFDRSTGFEMPFRALAALAPSDGECVASENLGESERALVHYYAGVRTVRVERAPVAAGACRYLLVQMLGADAAGPPPDETQAALTSLARAGDRRLRFELLVRDPDALLGVPE